MYSVVLNKGTYVSILVFFCVIVIEKLISPSCLRIGLETEIGLMELKSKMGPASNAITSSISEQPTPNFSIFFLGVPSF